MNCALSCTTEKIPSLPWLFNYSQRMSGIIRMPFSLTGISCWRISTLCLSIECRVMLKKNTCNPSRAHRVYYRIRKQLDLDEENQPIISFRIINGLLFFHFRISRIYIPTPTFSTTYDVNIIDLDFFMRYPSFNFRNTMALCFLA